MSDLLSEFARQCADAEVHPPAALRAGGVHPSLWWKWESGKVSPTLRNFEKARAGLRKLGGQTETVTSAGEAHP